MTVRGVLFDRYQLQVDLESWIEAKSGRLCFGKTRMQTFLDAVPFDKAETTRKPKRASFTLLEINALATSPKDCWV
jgi:hypothetical protein